MRRGELFRDVTAFVDVLLARVGLITVIGPCPAATQRSGEKEAPERVSTGSWDHAETAANLTEAACPFHRTLRIRAIDGRIELVRTVEVDEQIPDPLRSRLAFGGVADQIRHGTRTLLERHGRGYG